MNLGWSSTSTLSDPSMLIIEPGVIIGIETLIAGHAIIHGKLFLRPIHLKKGCTIGVRSAIGAGCTIGENVLLEGAVDVMPGATIPDGVTIGRKSAISKEMKLTENTRYPGFMIPQEYQKEKK